jgi:predicted  nucleic acid-binding Zn-ribbon protein
MADANAMSTFDVKLKQLLMTCKRTDSVVDFRKDTAIKRQLGALKALTNEVETSRRAVEALKIEQKVNEDEVATWNSQVETELEKADDDVKRLAGRFETGKGEKCFRREIEIRDKTT